MSYCRFNKFKASDFEILTSVDVLNRTQLFQISSPASARFSALFSLATGHSCDVMYLYLIFNKTASARTVQQLLKTLAGFITSLVGRCFVAELCV